MSSTPRWQFDESCQVGVDYADPENARVYDDRHRRFRDIDAENDRIVSAVDLRSDHVLLELGAGTGLFSVYAADHCARVIATDISGAMLSCVERKAAAAGLANIECRQGGFLTYEHTGEPVDVVVSQVALHHLPDFWKQIALQRLFDMVKPGGRLYLRDVVFSFDTR
ncbi:MAG: class I SAM-dependent methyltransferase, partial [bacterium]|nr:class I SAM-dependent methyltransferase [bacterium]